MSGSPAKQPRFERLRAIHRRMPFETFQQLPHQLGWKHEYYGGKAHITPGPTLVTFVLPLEPPPAQSDKGIRPLLEKDLPALHSPFIDAFRLAPEYADFSLDEFHQRAAQYLHGFFGTVRGEWSPVSVVVEIQGRIVGAAMVKQRQSGPLLDCLFVCPGQARKGLGTALVNRVVEGLLQRGKLNWSATPCWPTTPAWPGTIALGSGKSQTCMSPHSVTVFSSRNWNGTVAWPTCLWPIWRPWRKRSLATRARWSGSGNWSYE